MAVFEVHRGVDRTVEVRGFTMQYLLMLMGLLVFCFVLYASLFSSGVSLLTTSLLVIGLLVGGFYIIAWANKTLGRKGLLKLRAGLSQPSMISRRQSVRALLSATREERYGR